MTAYTANDRDRFFDSLDIPRDWEAAMRVFDAHAAEIYLHMDRLVGDELVTHVWSRWNPDDTQRLANPSFRRAFANLLSNGLVMGYRLDRFRDISSDLPDPHPTSNNWVEPFESAIAARGRSNFRILLSRADHDSYLATNTAELEDDRWETILSRMVDALFYELGGSGRARRKWPVCSHAFH